MFVENCYEYVNWVERVMRKRYRERFEGSTILIKVIVKGEEERKMLFKGRNAVMSECCLELIFRSEL
jgi:hypothetical protein